MWKWNHGKSFLLNKSNPNVTWLDGFKLWMIISVFISAIVEIVAALAHSTSVMGPPSVLTLISFFIASPYIIAIFAHSFRVVLLVCVRALINDHHFLTPNESIVLVCIQLAYLFSDQGFLWVTISIVHFRTFIKNILSSLCGISQNDFLIIISEIGLSKS